MPEPIYMKLDDVCFTKPTGIRSWLSNIGSPELIDQWRLIDKRNGCTNFQSNEVVETVTDKKESTFFSRNFYIETWPLGG